MARSNQLRVLLVSNTYTPYGGGLVSSLNAHINALQQAGHEVRLVTLQFLDKHDDDPSYIIRIPTLFRFKYVHNHMGIPLHSLHVIDQIISDFKPDIVHVHHPFLLGPIGQKAARKYGIPVFFTYHSVYEAFLHNVPLPQFITEPLAMYWIKQFCRSVDGIITPSRAVAAQVHAFNTTQPIAVIPSAVQEEFILNGPPTHTNSNQLRLLTVSRFSKEKQLHTLLDVCAQLDPATYQFTLIGYGSEFKPLQHYAYHTLKLSPDRVSFIHKPSRADLINHYRHADLFLFSSSVDTQGMVLAESMASGVPVIAVDGPGQRDIIEQGKNGYIVQSLGEMQQMIEKIADDKEPLKSLKNNAWQTGKQYNLDRMANQLIEFYKSL